MKAVLGLPILSWLAVHILFSCLPNFAFAEGQCDKTATRPRILRALPKGYAYQDPAFIRKYRDLKWSQFSSSKAQTETVEKLEKNRGLSGVKLRDMMDRQGRMVFFRSLVTPYDSRYDGGPESEGGQLFATANPMSAFYWGGTADETVLILVQEPLKQKARGWPIGPRGTPSRLPFYGRVLLNQDSAFEQIDYEIVLPPRTANVVLQMSKDQFGKKLREFLRTFPDSRGPLAGQEFGRWLISP